MNQNPSCAVPFTSARPFIVLENKLRKNLADKTENIDIREESSVYKKQDDNVYMHQNTHELLPLQSLKISLRQKINKGKKIK